MDAFFGEIRIFPYTFAPRNWAFCNGQLLPISQNTALFSLLGTIYGGDGRQTFALPNLQGRVPAGQGQGPGLSSYQLGQSGGAPTVTLTLAQMAAHNHPMLAQNFEADLNQPVSNDLARGSSGLNAYATSTSTVPMSDQIVATIGGNQPHNNLQPYLTCNFNICLVGVYPQRQ